MGILSLFVNRNRLTVFAPLPLLDQWYFTLLRRSRNEKITEIKVGSLSWRLFTRLLSAGSLCSSPLVRVTQRWACLQQPRSQGPLSTSRKYFLKVERGPGNEVGSQPGIRSNEVKAVWAIDFRNLSFCRAIQIPNFYWRTLALDKSRDHNQPIKK